MIFLTLPLFLKGYPPHPSTVKISHFPPNPPLYSRFLKNKSSYFFPNQPISHNLWLEYKYSMPLPNYNVWIAGS